MGFKNRFFQVTVVLLSFILSGQILANEKTCPGFTIPPVINETLKTFEIPLDYKSNPRRMYNVLNDMELLDFIPPSDKSAIVFNQIKGTSFSLKPFLCSVIKGIVYNQPSILTFLATALKKGWLKKSHLIDNSIHFAYVLEFLTYSMANSNKFAKSLHNYYTEKRIEIAGLGNNPIINTIKLFKLTKCFFCSIKAVSVDPFITYLNAARDEKKYTIKEVTTLVKTGRFNFLDFILLTRKNNPSEVKTNHNLGLRINMQEAVFTDLRNGFSRNARAGFDMVKYLESKPAPEYFSYGSVEPKHGIRTFDIYSKQDMVSNKRIQFNLNEQWINLYEAWDMAFVLGNMKNLDLMFAKLLIPSVLSARSENYLVSRSVSLWTVINTVIFRKIKRGHDFEGPDNSDEMAREWGRINEGYARELVEQ